jgi:hypothetical protein
MLKISTRSILSLVMFLTIGWGPTYSSQATEIIEVVGQGMSNPHNIYCTSAACSNVANQISEEVRLLQAMHDTMPIDSESIQNDFCSALAANQPSHCKQFNSQQYWPDGPSYFNIKFMNIPPLTNGCGTGSLLEVAVGVIASYSGLPGFSGDINSPTAGKDFRPACNAHDICYASNSHRDACDTSFNQAMKAVCSGHGRCLEFSDLYFGAVRGVGEAAKEAAVKEAVCRSYKADFVKNC